MDCKKFRNTVADLFDKDIDPQVKADCEAHLSQCAECRAYFDDMLATAELLRPHHSPVTSVIKHHRASRRWLRVAATFIGAASLAGLAWAIVPFLNTRHTSEPPQPTQVSTPHPTSEGLGAGYSFSNLRLDSILSTVATHYGRAVSFRDTALQALRLSTVWNSEGSLAEFIATINEFDGLQLSDERDTIFVESAVGEEK